MDTETQVAKVADAPLPMMATQDSQSNQIISAVLGAVSDPTIDLDRMERLLAIRDDILEKEAEKEFSAAMARTQQTIGPIIKNKTNTHTRSSYSDLAAINAAVVPAYTAEGFSLSFSSRQADIADHLTIMCLVRHKGGHKETYEHMLPYDGAGQKGNTNKTPIHANASTVSYGQRYLTSMIFNVASFDDDAQAAAAVTQPEVPGISPDTLEDIHKGMEVTGKTLDECLKYVKTLFGGEYERLSELTEQEGKRLLNRLSKKADGNDQ